MIFYNVKIERVLALDVINVQEDDRCKSDNVHQIQRYFFQNKSVIYRAAHQCTMFLDKFYPAKADQVLTEWLKNQPKLV